jgi:hypothetical protein
LVVRDPDRNVEHKARRDQEEIRGEDEAHDRKRRLGLGWYSALVSSIVERALGVTALAHKTQSPENPKKGRDGLNDADRSTQRPCAGCSIRASRRRRC